jgi:dipeptidyl aminopeptidase/acylaminoacyl peptidase
MTKALLCLFILSISVSADGEVTDSASAFGERERVENTSLSPDGSQLAYVEPTKGQGNALYTVDLKTNGVPKLAMAATGDPERISWCEWVSNTRLVCMVWATLVNKTGGSARPISMSRLFAVDSNGGKLKLVSTRQGESANYSANWGGSLVDLLPGDDGAVMLGRIYVPESKTGSLLAKDEEGYGVDRIDTLTLRSKRIVEPVGNASEYISDGAGNVRIRGIITRTGGGYDSQLVKYGYRKRGSDKWEELSTYDSITKEGFNPYNVDPTQDVAYGFQKENGRQALYSIKLDGSFARAKVFDHPEVDVDGLVTIGRQRKIIGVSYATDKRYAHYFEPEFAALQKALAKTLPGDQQISFQGASADGQQVIVLTSSDVNPGEYYIYDKTAKNLRPLLSSRPGLAQIKLSEVVSVSIKASDGTMVPGYLTLPVGVPHKNLPAIVMPHGGPSARDEWGFDWLAQFFANRGFAVLQPNYRGSSGYGDSWYQTNGFQSWKAAIGDVNDSGRWLVSQGIANPSKLAIFGWSYGGYAALQSAVLDPGLFKAVVAVAPVTDLSKLKEESLNWSNYQLVQKIVGSGPHISEGSPARHADRFVAPVLLFHGDLDNNVSVQQSRLMDNRLEAAGKTSDLIIFKGLDHYLEDSSARTEMLSKSDAFLRKAMGM